MDEADEETEIYEHWLSEEYSEMDQPTTWDLIHSCTYGTLDSISGKIAVTLVFAVLQRINASMNIRYSAKHAITSLLGFALLVYWDLKINVIICFVCTASLIACTVTRLCSRYKFTGSLISILSFVVLIALEMTLPSDQFGYRGMLMIFAMKLSSLSIDMSEGIFTATRTEILGYFLNPATLMFGPAHPFSVYKDSLTPKSTREHFWELITYSSIALLATFCLLVSACFTQLMYPFSGILRRYADAQSFRFSHYFICYWSQALAGMSGQMTPLIVDLTQIEFPRSLTQVVSVWNAPMHQYLFRYVYNRVRGFGSGISILATFAASSLFHGLNGQLSAVLLSLGLLSWGELRLRRRLSLTLSACVRARRCPVPCTTHSHSSSSLLALSINASFALLAIYNLIYLGMPWNEDGQEIGYPLSHTLSVWREHYFASHLIALLYVAFSSAL